MSRAVERPLVYPKTEAQDVAEIRFGTTVRDPYRWLEAEARNDAKVRAWIDAQNEVSGAYLSRLPQRDAIAERLKRTFNFGRYTAPRKEGGRYFYVHNSGLQNQGTLMVQGGLNAAPRLLLDPNSWSSDGATALGEWSASPDGKLVAYSIQDGGTDWRTIRVLEVDGGKMRNDEVPWVKMTVPLWSKDGSGFFYLRAPEPAKGDEYQSINSNFMVYFHALGTDQSADRLMYSVPEHPNLLHFFQLACEGRYLLITSLKNADSRASITLIDLRQPGSTPRKLISGWDDAWGFIGSQGDTLYFITDREAPNHSVVAMELTQADPIQPTVILPEGPHAVDAAVIGGRLVVKKIVDAKSELQIFDLAGQAVTPVELPGIGAVTALEGDEDDAEAFYTFESFNVPPHVYRLDVSTGRSTLFKQPQAGFDSSQYTVRQVFYASKDGTRVPMFIAHRKDLDLGKAHPTLLYGYGGFGISHLPMFRAPWLAWMEMGGIYALANIRGGGEYGRAWHDSGRLFNRQNVYDDFIAAAEYLIAAKLTTVRQLAIQGGSAGGLLVGAVVNQRPDLFAAVLAQVGVMDMLRYDQFTVGPYWVSDYGDPAEEAHFRNLLSYSPYHNIHSGKDYPAILTTTADTDDRVVPGHSFKYAAALQAAQIGLKPHLLRVETRAGHGMGKPLSKAIEEVADLWAFAGYFTGLTGPAA